MPNLDRPAKFQATVFLTDPQWGSGHRLATELMGLLQPEIEAYPLPFEVPPEGPASVPRALLRRADGGWHVMVSLERIDLSAYATSETGITEIGRVEFWRLASTKLRQFVERFDLDVGRVAGVASYYGETVGAEGNPAEYIQTYYFSSSLQSAWFEHMENSEFHVLQVSPWSSGSQELRVNQWTRLKAVRRAQTNEPLLELLMDVNTVPAPNTTLSLSEIEAFFDAMEPRVESVFSRISKVHVQ